MSMSPLVVKLQKALAGVGVVTGNTQGDVLIAAINHIKSSAGSNPIPAIQFDEPEMQFDETPWQPSEKTVAAMSARAKPKATPKAKKK